MIRWVWFLLFILVVSIVYYPMTIPKPAKEKTRVPCVPSKDISAHFVSDIKIKHDTICEVELTAKRMALKFEELVTNNPGAKPEDLFIQVDNNGDITRVVGVFYVGEK